MRRYAEDYRIPDVFVGAKVGDIINDLGEREISEVKVRGRLNHIWTEDAESVDATTSSIENKLSQIGYFKVEIDDDSDDDDDDGGK